MCMTQFLWIDSCQSIIFTKCSLQYNSYGRQRVIRRILRSRAASPSDGVYHATSSVRRAAFPCCHIVFSRCQPTSSPRTSFPGSDGSGSRMPSPGDGRSGGRMPFPSGGLPRRLPNAPRTLGPRALSFTEPHAATWDAGRITSPAEVYQVADDNFSPNHWTPNYLVS